MTDPRNIAHDKKVQQEKSKQGIENAPDAINMPQPGKKPPLDHHIKDAIPHADQSTNAGGSQA